jgi:predicted membrane-bound mannosyltransferase
MKRFLQFQVRSMASLWPWIRRRRQDVGPGDVPLAYARDQLPMLIAFACVMGLETLVVGLLVPWPIVHVLDVLAILQVLGLAATAVTRPHYIHKDTLVLREGTHFEIKVPLASVAAVQVARQDHNGRTVEQDGEKLTIAVGSQTTVLVTLVEPVPGGTAKVLRFHADEPQAAVLAIKNAIPVTA